MKAEIFYPVSATASIASTTTAGTDRVALPTNTDTSDDTVSKLKPINIRVANDSDKTQYIQFGSGTVTAAAASSLPILPGAIEIIAVSQGNTYVASVVASGTATGKIYFTLGYGA